MGILLLKRSTQPVNQERVTFPGVVNSQGVAPTGIGTGSTGRTTVRPTSTVTAIQPLLARGTGTVGRTTVRPNIAVASRVPSGSLIGGSTPLQVAIAQANANPGTFVLIPNVNYGSGVTVFHYIGGSSASVSVFDWQSKVAWSGPGTKQIKGYGSPHTDPDRQLVYDEATNAWIMQLPDHENALGTSHWLDTNACDPSNGDMIFAQGSGNANTKAIFRIPHGSTVAPPPPIVPPTLGANWVISGSPFPVGPPMQINLGPAWEYFPDIDSYYAGGTGVSAVINRITGAQTFCTPKHMLYATNFTYNSVPTPGMDYTLDSNGGDFYGQCARYCPGRHCVYVFGGIRLGGTEVPGSPCATNMWKIPTDLVAVKLDNLPYAMSFWNQVTVSANPDRLVAVRWNGQFPSGAPEIWDFDEARTVGQRWKRRSSLEQWPGGTNGPGQTIYTANPQAPGNDGVNGAHIGRATVYIPEYNVTVFIAVQGSNGAPNTKMYVYKHPTGDT